MPAKYNYRPEYRKYRFVSMPTSRVLLQVTNRMMPVVQKANSPYEDKLSVEEISFDGFGAQMICPKGKQVSSCLIYLHGGAFAMKAARYHKNLVRQYACEAQAAVLFADYRLAPQYRYPVPLMDCFEAYQWAVDHFDNGCIFVGGDSAGGNLAAAVTLKAIQEGVRIPDKLLLIYPVTDSRLITASMDRYTDTPLWNAKQNRKMWPLYADEQDRHSFLVSPAEAPEDCLRQFPKTFIETAEYDCLRDEGIRFAERLRACGVKVMLHNTVGTIHGFDIEEKSAYVKKCVAQRVKFLRAD